MNITIAGSDTLGSFQEHVLKRWVIKSLLLILIQKKKIKQWNNPDFLTMIRNHDFKK